MVNNTAFSEIYSMFLSKITDDMYLELSELETYRLMQDLLGSAVQKFEFPRVCLDYEEEYVEDARQYCGIESENIEVPMIVYGGGFFFNRLSREECNIIAVYMVEEWIGQQLASVEVTRQKYAGSDFKMTSQANHMAKLNTLKKHYREEGFHLQRLYKRRKSDDNGIMRSTFGSIMYDE